MLDLSKHLDKVRENHHKLSSEALMIGLICVLGTAICQSTVGVVTRHVNSIHFSVILFHFAWFSTFMLASYLGIEYLRSDLSEPRLFGYDYHSYIICLVACISNAIGLNFLTIAWQNDKSAFVALVGNISVVYGLIIDVELFGLHISW